MRKKKQIQDDGARVDVKTLEVLLDIRELLIKATPKKKNRRKESE